VSAYLSARKQITIIDSSVINPKSNGKNPTHK